MTKRVSSSFSVSTVEDGERGKTGRFYYYATEWNGSDQSYTCSATDAQAPYFKVTNGNNYNYYVYVGEANFTDKTMYWIRNNIGAPSSTNAAWRIMANDFKYIISEAIFAEFAHLGGFIMSDPWMISQTAASGSPSQSYSSFDGDPVNGQFRPMFAVNGQTGAIYMQNAYLKGEVEAISGKIGGFSIVNEELKVGDETSWTDLSSQGLYTLIGKGRLRVKKGDSNRFSKAALGAGSKSNSDEKTLLYIIRDDRTEQYTNSPIVDLTHVGLHGGIAERINDGLFVTQDGVINNIGMAEIDSNIGFGTFLRLNGSNILLKNVGSNHTLTIPSASDILADFFYGKTTFAIELTFITHILSVGTITLVMPSGGSFVDYRGNTIQNPELTASRYLKLLLVYDGTNYYAQKVYSSYNMENVN